MSTPQRQRTFVAKHTTMTSRLRVYALADAVEIEERVYSLQRRRVLFDEVQLITLHRRRRWPVITFLLLMTFSFVAFAALFFSEAETTAFSIFAGFALLFLLFSAWYIALPAHVLTLTSRRNREEIQFGFREGRARQWFGQLQRSIREAQNRMAEEVAQQNAAARRLASMAGPLPMPPSAATTAAAAVMPTPAPSSAAPPAGSAAVPNTPATPHTLPQDPPFQGAPLASPGTSETPAPPPPPPDFLPPRG